jgi:hypothetical protein
VVGWYEYTRALSLLDPLINMVDADELRVIEEIVRERDEFTVYTDLSRRLNPAAFAAIEETGRAGAAERRGLAWMMALARVELGAMAAGFTDHGEPFAVLPPGQYEASAYLDLLTDGARMHVLALRNDPIAQYYASMQGRSVSLQEAVFGPNGAGRGSAELALANEQRAIAYSRRVVLAGEFIAAALKFGGSHIAPAQQAELASYREPLHNLEQVLLYKVLGVGSGETSSTKTTVVRTESGPKDLCACPRLMKMIQRDLASGRGRSEIIHDRGSSTQVSR